MRLLLICQTSETGNDATPNLCRGLCSAFAALGHEVFLLDVATCGDTPEGVHRFYTDSPAERKLHEITGGGRQSKAKALLRLAGHPAAALAGVKLVLLHRPPMAAAYRRRLNRLAKTHCFDAAIAFSAPYTTAEALANARIHCVKAACFYDPYSLMPGYSSPYHRQNELHIGSSLGHIFCTEQILERIPGSHLRPLLPKMSSLPFPGIRRPKPAPKPAFLEGPHKNLVFVGNVYPKIRSPEPLLRLFTALPLPGWRLVMVGGGWENLQQESIAQYEKSLGPRLLRTGSLPQAQAFAAMQHADVLADIGNTTPLQMPSKVFDYISTGRPILHLQQHPQDPSGEYYAKYPRSYTVMITDQAVVTSPPAENLVKFLEAAPQPPLAFEHIEAAYWDNTPKAVALEMIKKISIL